jgi:ribonuclease HI
MSPYGESCFSLLDIMHEKGKVIKLQILPNFMAVWLELQNTGPPDISSVWTISFDGSKRVEGARAGVVLISPQGDKMKYVLQMSFPNASKNEAEYEALLHGMRMAKASGATRLKIFGDSSFVVQHVINLCDTLSDNILHIATCTTILKETLMDAKYRTSVGQATRKPTILETSGPSVYLFP